MNNIFFNNFIPLNSYISLGQLLLRQILGHFTETACGQRTLSDRLVCSNTLC